MNVFYRKLYSDITKNFENIFSIAGVLAVKSGQVLIQVVLVRLLTAHDYSQFYFYFSAVTGLSMFIGDGIGLSASRFIATVKKTDHDVVPVALATGLMASCFSGFLLILHTFYLNNNVTEVPILILIVLYAMSLSYSSTLQYVVVSTGNRRYLATIQIIFALIVLLLTGLSGWLYGWREALLSLLLCVTASNLCLLVQTVSLKTLVAALTNRFYDIKSLIKKSLPICGAMALGGPIHVYCLSVLKNAPHTGLHELGVFGISFVTYTLVSFLPGALGQFLVPWLLRNEDSHGKAFRAVLKMYAAAGAAILAVILIANSIGLNSLLPSLLEAKNTIYILSVTGYIAGFIALYSFLLNALYRSRWVLISSIYHSVSYILLTHVFISHLKYGANGLALAILCSSLGQLVLLIFIKRKKIDTPVSGSPPERTQTMSQISAAKKSESLLYAALWYVMWHYSLIYKVCGRLILLTDKHVFCTLFNIAAKLRGVDLKFSYNSKDKKYTATSENYKLYFFHRHQAHAVYNASIEKRIESLSNVYFLPQIEFKDGDLVVDCGANVGDLYLYFKSKKINIEYIAFEPSPLEHQCLQQNIAPQVAHNAGLWHEDGSLKFYVSSEGADSSFIKPRKFDEIQNIPTKRLDTILKRPIKLLKLEAEGAEPEVLLGCSELLPQIEYIAADLGFERGEAQTSTLEPVINYLIAHNFELVSIKHERITALFRNKKFNNG